MSLIRKTLDRIYFTFYNQDHDTKYETSTWLFHKEIDKYQK